MTDFPYHMEALRKQRIIDRKHEALENLARKKTAQENEKRLETREGANLESRMGTRESTRAANSRQVSQQTASIRYRYRNPIQAKAEPLHQWRDLQNNHLHHEARSLDKPYSTERKDGKGKDYWQRS